MAIITASTFDPLKARCAVRLQQGVPIVDADWNEMDDIRKFEMRAFLKWFVGDGVPAGQDPFRITATGATDDFTIAAGPFAAANPGASPYDAGLRQTGRMLVDGMDVFIGADVAFKGQALFGKPGPAGEPPVQPVPAATTVLVYIDVWERLVTAQDDPALVLAGLGTESCARLQRAWAVRARAGNGVPAPGSADYAAGHSYAALALIQRQGASDPIAAATLSDLRRRGLVMHTQAEFDAVANDAFGPGYASPLSYSLREVLNGLVRSQKSLVATAPRALFDLPLPGGNPLGNPPLLASARDGAGAVWLAAVSGSSAAPSTLQLTLRKTVRGAWDTTPAALAFTPDVLSIQSLAMVSLASGGVRVFYTSLAASRHAFSRVFNGKAWGAEETVDATGDCFGIAATADGAGVVTVAWGRSTPPATPSAPTSFALQAAQYAAAGTIGATVGFGALGFPGLPVGISITAAADNTPIVVFFEGTGEADIPALGHARKLVGGAWTDPAGGNPPVAIPSISTMNVTDANIFYSKAGELWIVYATTTVETLPGAVESFYEAVIAKRLVPATVLIGPAPTPTTIEMERTVARTGSASVNLLRQPCVTTDKDGNAAVLYRSGATVKSAGLVGGV